MPIPGFSQTNHVATNSPTHITPDASRLTLAARKRLAIAQLNGIFTLERDRVRQETEITLRMQSEETFGLELELTCYTSQEHPIPEDFILHFISRSDDWQFLKYSEFIINSDGAKMDFGELHDDGDVLDGGHVLEQMIAHVPYEQFRTLTRAKSVMFNLGSLKNMMIVPSTRAKWQILLNYFEILKEEQAAKSAATASADH